MSYYTIHHFCQETGEDYTEGAFCDYNEALNSRMHKTGGYGDSVEIVEISREEAIDILTFDIDECVEEKMRESGDVTRDDEEILEGWFFEEVEWRINNRWPGWQLLKEIV